MKNMLLILTLGMVLISCVSATLSEDIINIKIYNSNPFNFSENLSDWNNRTLSFVINMDSYNYDINDETYTFNLDLKDYLNNATNLFSGSMNYIDDVERTNINYLEEYTKCISDKSSLDRSYTICSSDLSDCRDGNSTACQNKINPYILQVQQKDLDLESKDKEIKDLTDEQDKTKNSHWFWAAGGAILGILGLLFKQGKLGGSPKDRSEEEFNRMQAG